MNEITPNNADLPDYTEDEKELLAVIKFLKEAFETIVFKDDEMIRVIGEDFLLGCEGHNKVITDFAIARQAALKAAQDEEINRWKYYYDEKCRKCGRMNSLQPIGEYEAVKGFTFYNFKCAGCRNNFVGFLPVDDHEALAWYERYMARIIDPARRADPFGKDRKLNVEEKAEMLESFHVFKQQVMAKDKETADKLMVDECYCRTVKNDFNALHSLQERIITMQTL